MTAADRDLARRIDVAAGLLQGLAERDVPLAPLTTYKVGGSAALFARPRTVDDLARVADACRQARLPVLVVGRGSNLLVADDGFAGVAVSLGDLRGDALGTDVRVEGTQVVAGGAVALPVLARRTAAASLTGFEWAVGVPGSVGGGVRMNAGGHGSDMAACLVEVDLFDLHRDAAEARATLPASQLGLRFRGSDLADHQIVLSARLQLSPGDRERSERELDEIVRWRREHQPGGQNAGSVFVNPVPGEVPAGALIDRMGLRGFRLGTAHVSDKHANFIQADDGGRAADVHALMELVREKVAAETGYHMRSEVRLVGFGIPDPHDPAGVRW
ncbi:MAG: UDP-N-acetylmuramate dehydrogenase [Acidimicrobiales bacterium]